MPMIRLAALPASGVTDADVLALLESLKARGLLTPNDENLLVSYRQKVAQAAPGAAKKAPQEAGKCATSSSPTSSRTSCASGQPWRGRWSMPACRSGGTAACRAPSWRENIAAALHSAKCVVVVWSHGSVGVEGAFVRDEAGRAMARDILVPVLIDKVAPPLGFGELQAIDLTAWRGNPRDPFFQDLVAVIRAKLDHTPAPPPKGPTRRVMRRLFYGATSSGAVAAVALFGFNTFGVASNVCTLPGAPPGLSDFCGACRMGEGPSGE